MNAGDMTVEELARNYNVALQQMRVISEELSRLELAYGALSAVATLVADNVDLFGNGQFDVEVKLLRDTVNNGKKHY